jgi:hypothetical protein
VEEIDTNVVALDLESVRDPAPSGGAEDTCALRCGNPKCGAFFTVGYSKFREEASSGSGGAVWSCEFCGTSNALPGSMFTNQVGGHDESGSVEVPELGDSPSVVEFALTGSKEGAELSARRSIIFVCDISGSMLASAPSTVRRSKEQLAIEEKEVRSMLESCGMTGTDLDEQVRYTMAEKARRTYVTRMEGLQQAISSQLEALKAEEEGSVSVGIVTFGSYVKIETPEGAKRIEGEALLDVDALLERGKGAASSSMMSPHTQEVDLKRIVTGLEAGGTTALGPAVLVGVGMASEIGSGSRVVVITDGLANVGVGSLETRSTALEALADDLKGAPFYAKAGTIAASKGVVVDVVGIQGEGASLEHLGDLAHAANGEIASSPPDRLWDQFKIIFNQDVLATKAVVSMVIGNLLAFRKPEAWGWLPKDADTEAPPLPSGPGVEGDGSGPHTVVTGEVSGPERTFEGGEGLSGVAGPSRIWRQLGNVAPGTEFSLEFGPRAVKIPEDVKAVPFQMQVWFNRPGDERRMLRVITQLCPVTADLDEAVNPENVQGAVLASYARSRAAQLAAQGQYKKSRQIGHGYGVFLAQNAVLNCTDEEVHRLSAVPAPTSQGIRRKELHTAKARRGRGTLGVPAAAESDEDAGSDHSSSADEAPVPAPSAVSLLDQFALDVTPLDDALRSEIATEQAQGMRLDDSSFVDHLSGFADSGPASDDDEPASHDYSGESPAPLSADVDTRSDFFGGLFSARGRPNSSSRGSAPSSAPSKKKSMATPSWAMSAAPQTHTEMAQAEVRSQRRAKNDSLSSVIQNSMRRGTTARAYQATTTSAPGAPPPASGSAIPPFRPPRPPTTSPGDK